MRAFKPCCSSLVSATISRRVRLCVAVYHHVHCRSNNGVIQGRYTRLASQELRLCCTLPISTIDGVPPWSTSSTPHAAWERVVSVTT